MRQARELLAVIALGIMLALCAKVALGAGYTSRACGLDMNRDGTIGEAADCNVCDGATVDPDGDSTEEDINYIDADAGVDDVNCGAAGDACATLAWVMAGSNSSYAKAANGPGDGQEDIVCLKGTLTASAQELLDLAGVTGSYAAALYTDDTARWSATEDEHFRYPDNPFMLVGWDDDNDGSYPPHDTDDTAIIDCETAPSTYTARLFSHDAAYTEMAHFTIKNCGRDTTGESGAGFSVLNANVDYTYIHDIEFEQVLKDSRQSSPHILMSLFSGDGSSYFAFVHNSVTEMAGFGFRGSCGSCTDFRVDYNTVTVHALNSGESVQPGVTFYRGWDTMDRVSVSWNNIDADPDAWGATANETVVGIAASICVQGFEARGNVLTDFRSPTRVRVTSTVGECQSRPTIATFDRNTISMNYATWNNDRAFNVAEEGSHPNIYLKDLIFTNNMIDCSVQIEDGFLAWGGSDDTDFTGTYTVAHNTIECPVDQSAFDFDDVISLNNADVVFSSNVVQGLAEDGSRLIRFNYADASLSGDNNIYDPTTSGNPWVYNGSGQSTLAGWRTASSIDTNADECAPSFVSATDLHLQSGDTCAAGAGIQVAGVTVDIDGDARANPPDAGADEITAAESGGASVLDAVITSAVISLLWGLP